MAQVVCLLKPAGGVRPILLTSRMLLFFERMIAHGLDMQSQVVPFNFGYKASNGGPRLYWMVRLERERALRLFRSKITDIDNFLEQFDTAGMTDVEMADSLWWLIIQFQLDLKNGFNDLKRKAIINGWQTGTPSMVERADYRRIMLSMVCKLLKPDGTFLLFDMMTGTLQGSGFGASDFVGALHNIAQEFVTSVQQSGEGTAGAFMDDIHGISQLHPLLTALVRLRSRALAELGLQLVLPKCKIAFASLTDEHLNRYAQTQHFNRNREELYTALTRGKLERYKHTCGILGRQQF
jgi:hypothetical protein